MIDTKNCNYREMKIIRHTLLWLSFVILSIESLRFVFIKPLGKYSPKPTEKKLLDTIYQDKQFKKFYAISPVTASSHFFFQHKVQEDFYETLLNIVLNRMTNTRKTATSSFHSTQRVTYLRNQWSAISET